MALLSKKPRTDDVSDPAKLLVAEHQKVELLFAQIEGAESDNQRRTLVAQLEAELSSHMLAEEQRLYPAIRAEVPDGDELMDRAEAEHGQAKEALAKVVSADPSDPSFNGALKTLKKLVKAHVKEEEKRVFPKLEDALDGARLGELRGDLEEVKFATTPTRPLDVSTAPRSSSPTKRSAAKKATAKKAVAKRSAAKRSTSRTSSATSVWVQSHPDDRRWQVKREGAARASRVFPTQRAAEEFARSVAKRERVELVVAGRDGKIKRRDSHGNDPRSSKG